MTIIYNNILATAAAPVDFIVTGCENQILFKASDWGTTQVQVDSYSANDPSQKLTNKIVAAGANMDWCLPCISVGEVYRFTVLTPDVLTNELFVEILEEGCCCDSSGTTCFEIPARIVPCA